jgi:hypothetical protein
VAGDSRAFHAKRRFSSKAAVRYSRSPALQLSREGRRLSLSSPEEAHLAGGDPASSVQDVSDEAE